MSSGALVAALQTPRCTTGSWRNAKFWSASPNIGFAVSLSGIREHPAAHQPRPARSRASTRQQTSHHQPAGEGRIRLAHMNPPEINMPELNPTPLQDRIKHRRNIRPASRPSWPHSLPASSSMEMRTGSRPWTSSRTARNICSWWICPDCRKRRSKRAWRTARSPFPGTGQRRTGAGIICGSNAPLGRSCAGCVA